MATTPSCGLYRTRIDLGPVPEGKLVYFHNHGEGGPGIYLPKGWALNRAQFHEQGLPLPNATWLEALEPLVPEGLYRVQEPFSCCEKGCRHFGEELLVQLGYDGDARPILFVPELSEQGLGFPSTGMPIDPERIAKLSPLKVVMHELPHGAVQ